MTTRDTVNRRNLVATIAGGAVLGGLWGAAFPALATERRPTVAVVGEGNAQIVLVDSGAARALILAGEPEDTLFEELPAMMTMFRQRIDLLIGAGPTLRAHAGRLASRWRTSHALMMSSGADAPSLPIAHTVVSETVRFRLSATMRGAVHIGHRNEWRAGEPERDTPLWAIRIADGPASITIAPNVASYAATAPEPATVLISPHAPATALLAISPVSAMAINYDSHTIDPPAENGPALTRIYPHDVARFVFEDDGVQLPEWSMPGPGSAET